MRRNSVVSARSDLWYEARKSAVPGGSLLHYKEKVVQCEEKLYSIRMVTCGVGRQVCGVRTKSAVSGVSHMQYK